MWQGNYLARVEVPKVKVSVGTTPKPIYLLRQYDIYLCPVVLLYVFCWVSLHDSSVGVNLGKKSNLKKKKTDQFIFINAWWVVRWYVGKMKLISLSHLFEGINTSSVNPGKIRRFSTTPRCRKRHIPSGLWLIQIWRLRPWIPHVEVSSSATNCGEKCRTLTNYETSSMPCTSFMFSKCWPKKR